MKEDVEERLIGLGQPAGLLRLFYAFLPLSAVSLVPSIQADSNPKWSLLAVGACVAPGHTLALF